jgi:hypothetical protein
MNKTFSQVPVVLPVIAPDVKPSHHPPLHPHLPQIDGPGGGALVLMISPIKTGKSTLISNIMLNDNFYNGQERFDQVKVISNTIANDVTSRFLAKAFDCHDFYSDEIIDGIVAHQKSFEKEDQPEIAVILDDCLGSIRREAKINHLASRFRHFNIKLLIISSQNFRMCSPIIRQNATNVIVGSPFPNEKELGKLAEEYGDQFGGADNWLRIYHAATPNRYDFLHMDLQGTPTAYHNFEKVIAVGGQKKVEVGNIEGGQKLNLEETKENKQ